MKPMQRDLSTVIFLVNDRPVFREVFITGPSYNLARCIGSSFCFFLAGCGEAPTPALTRWPARRFTAAPRPRATAQRLEGQPTGVGGCPTGGGCPHRRTTRAAIPGTTDEVLFGITVWLLPPYAPPGYESDMPAFSGKLSDDEIRRSWRTSPRTSADVLDARAEMMRSVEAISS
jgi:hypothetical protein